jgi:anti-anti-sigma factor
MHRPLGSRLTCQHLTVGADAQAKGRFYPRCALGTAAARKRWVAEVGQARLDVMRALREEFDAWVEPRRRRLFEAKARALENPGRTAPRERLERELVDFRVAITGFLAERKPRFEDVGLPLQPLARLVDEWARAWVDSRHLGALRLSASAFAAFPPQARAFFGALVEPEDAAEGDEGAAWRVLFADEQLEVSIDAAEARLRFSGDLDLANADPLAASLASLADGPGDLELDLGGLLFCDVAGLRVLVGLAARSEGRRRLVVRRMPAHLRRAMRLAGWSAVPNLVLGAEPELAS